MVQSSVPISIKFARREVLKMGKNNHLRHPGIEPGSIAWEATMLTTTPIAQQLSLLVVRLTHSVGFFVL